MKENEDNVFIEVLEARLATVEKKKKVNTKSPTQIETVIKKGPGVIGQNDIQLGAKILFQCLEFRFDTHPPRSARRPSNVISVWVRQAG